MSLRTTLEQVGLFVLGLTIAALTFLAGYYAHAFSGQLPVLRWALPGLPAGVEQYGLLAETRALVEQHFNGPIPEPNEIDQALARGYVQSLGDPYSVFIDPPNAELESDSLSGEYGGIGVSIGRNEADEIVLDPFPDSPAIRAGVQRGDVLVRVDDLAITPETPTEAVTSAVRGPVDTEVTITVRRGADELSFTLTRAVIALPSVRGQLVDGQPEMGWIRVDRFSDKTAEELATVSQELADQGATRYILDLRNNGGGLVDSAVETASLVLDGGVVLYEQSKTEGERTYNASNAASVLKNAPLVVLVNHNTASAAEILAGAIAAQGRAPLIGQQTFGKGSVQFVFTLSDGSSVHITAKTWQTPDRQDLNGNGLTPTIAIEPGTDGQDPELVAAIEVLLEQR